MKIKPLEYYLARCIPPRVYLVIPYINWRDDGNVLCNTYNMNGEQEKCSVMVDSVWLENNSIRVKPKKRVINE